MNPRGIYLRNWLQAAGFDPFDDEKPADAPMVEKRWESILKTYRGLRSPDLDGAEPETILGLMRTFESRMDQFVAWCGVELLQMHEWLDQALQ